VGPFLQAILLSLESFFSHSSDYNLFFTGLLTKIAQYPVPSIIRFLTEDSVPSSERLSLTGILQMLSKTLKTAYETQPKLHVSVSKLKFKLDNQTKKTLGSAKQDSTIEVDSHKYSYKTFVRASVIFNELCLDLPATLSTVLNIIANTTEEKK